VLKHQQVFVKNKKMHQKFITTISGICAVLVCVSQQPVQWNYSTKKIGDLKYEIHIVASIEPPYHIYSKDNNEDLGQPTIITFQKSPILKEDQEVTEVGDLKKELINKNTISYFERKVEFIQVIELTANVKTNVKGTISFMACTNTHCLPPEKRNFSIMIGGT
jgi:hypothetical protein